jgi:tRNA-dihydrouridine synthase A
VQEQFVEYTQNWLLACQESGRPERFQLAGITRHILGFAHGLGGSRLWRQQLSDHRLLHRVKTVEQVRQFFEIASTHLRIFSDHSDSYILDQQID